MGIHHVKGFQDPSTYSKYNGGITCCTNFWTPCSIIYPSNVRTQVNCVLVDIRLSLSLTLFVLLVSPQDGSEIGSKTSWKDLHFTTPRQGRL